MVSFRFHIVSITAIFLAIAVGVVVGSTFVDRAIVDSLRSRIDSVSENLDERRTENARLEAEVGRYRDYVEGTSAFAVSTRLADTPVLVLAARGVDDDVVRDVVLLAERAGAEVPGIAWIEAGWALDDEDASVALRGVLDVSTGSPERTRDRAIAAVASELTAPVQGPAPDAGEAGADDGPTTTQAPGAPPDGQAPVEPPPPSEAPEDAPPPAVPAPVLDGLVDTGFLTFEPRAEASPTLTSLAGRDPAVLVVTGTEAEPSVRGVLGFFVETLSAFDLVVAVGEVYRQEGDGGGDEPARGERASEAVPEAVRDRVAVVDHLDVTQGRVAVVLALSELRHGVVGHYGYGPGADAVLPPWAPP